jgi:hypothetical protein
MVAVEVRSGIEGELTFLDAVQQAEAKIKAPANVPAIGDK